MSLGFTNSVVTVLAVAFGIGSVLTSGCRKDGETTGYRPAQSGTLTFTKDIAPIIFDRCSTCHRPGEVAPFSLLTAKDVRKRTRQIVEVTQSRYMPPWLPESEPGEFLEQGRLSDLELGTIAQWVAEGAREGDPQDLPPLPEWPEGWQLGTPDLIVEMPEAYTLQAGGEDVFRNFVIPLPVEGRRYVRAVELRPDNQRIVHHAVMMVDEGPSSRRLDVSDPEPGFGGMSVSDAHSPDGFFLGWTPGRQPYAGRDGMAWIIDKGVDFVLNVHLPPSGRVEMLRAKVGFFFSETPPTKFSSQLRLGTSRIDIPAGEANYVVRDEYRLPVDVEVLSVYPHAHFLAKEMKSYAELPDGTRRRLLHIREWDFNWQDEYRFRHPMPLVAGTKLTFEYTYDNTAENVRNPHQPPRRVVFGPQSTDEMGDLWIQVMPRSRADLVKLENDFRAKDAIDRAEGFRAIIAGDYRVERKIQAQNSLGKLLCGAGKPAEAVSHLRRAIELDPEFVFAHNNLATALHTLGKLDDAAHHFNVALGLSPRNPAMIRYNLALTLCKLGREDEAIAELRDVLSVRTDFEEAHNNLGNLLRKSGKTEEAVEHFQRAFEINSDRPLICFNLGSALKALGRFDDAIDVLDRAVRLVPGNGRFYFALGQALEGRGRVHRAQLAYAEALRLVPGLAGANRRLAALRKTGG